MLLAGRGYRRFATCSSAKVSVRRAPSSFAGVAVAGRERPRRTGNERTPGAGIGVGGIGWLGGASDVPQPGQRLLRSAVKARGQRDLITVIGHAPMIAAGEFVQLTGAWINDRTHGEQFRATFLKTSPPTTRDGIERYLGSRMIRGIGAVYAKRLVRGHSARPCSRVSQSPFIDNATPYSAAARIAWAAPPG